MKITPNLQDLVLLGGGHAHALLISLWRMQPLPGVRITLISPDTDTPYSGMLPGLIAGHYAFRDTHIDLDRLCAAAGVRFIRARCTGLDLDNKTLRFEQRPALGFDLLSINTGATPDLSVPGSAEHATAVKPISAFYPRWQAVEATLRERPTQHLAIVGGGAAAVELAAAFRHRAPSARISLFFPDPLPLAGYRSGFRTLAARKLRDLSIALESNNTIVRVESGSMRNQSDRPIPFDHLFWCAQASAPAWLAEAGLAVDGQGFLAVEDTLQSTSHAFVFGAGDVVSLAGQPRPKAGVFAVRQAPVLLANLRASLLKQALVRYRAQASFLSLLSLANGSALGTRANGWLPNLSGRWVWRWKNRIDRRFMAMFEQLQPMVEAPAQNPAAILWGDAEPPASALAMRCGGCGAKVGADVLSEVIHKLETVKHPEVTIGLDDPDDAAAIQFQAQTLLVQSVDQFRSLIDDPFLQGQIAALHALSDVHAMNARPHSAQALVTLPFAREALTARDLHQLMAGALNILNLEDCQLIGGHTSEGLETCIGFAVNGVANQLMTKSGLTVGDSLILTQPLGTGALYAARHALFTRGTWLQAAQRYMLQSNRVSAEILYRHGAHACTDVTGFGLAGHLIEMLRASACSAHLFIDEIPSLEGALACIDAGFTSSLQRQNQRRHSAIKDSASWLGDARFQLLFDPQTSGGLLAGVSAQQTAAVLDALNSAGYSACHIGTVTPADAYLIALIER